MRGLNHARGKERGEPFEKLFTPSYSILGWIGASTSGDASREKLLQQLHNPRGYRAKSLLLPFFHGRGASKGSFGIDRINDGLGRVN